MKTTLIHNFGKKEESREIIQNFSVKNIEERSEKIDFKSFKGSKKEITLEGVKITVAEVFINEPITFNVAHSFPFFKVQFEIEGYSSYLPENKESIPVLIEQGHYNFFYFPKVKGVLNYYKYRKIVEILFTEDYIKNVFKDNFKKITANFGRAIESKIPFILFKKSKPISYKLQLILDDIVNCSYEKELKKIYLSSKITEVLSILIADLKQPETNGIKLSDQLKINQSCIILNQNLQNPPTIIQLSKMLGINQQKLKVLFKQTYKTTIFKHLTNQRMMLAKKLLTKDVLTISEISSEVGYKNPQHFTVAFKKKFNILPRDFKNVT